MSTVIKVEQLRKEYRRYRRPLDRLKEILPILKPRYTPFVALDDVSFTIEEGETVGIIGQNGAGKSTLLQILAGVLEPSRGHCQVVGRIGSLLELGAGFHPEFKGVDNVHLQGQLLGLPPAYIASKLQQIIEFADIGDFVYQPVKSYSSGMFVRLAFSTAIHFEPELLIVDEALAVGDVFFQHKCMDRMKRFQAEGKTILFVSHDPQAVRHLCNRAIHLRKGRIVNDGDPADVVARFLQERTATFTIPKEILNSKKKKAPAGSALDVPPLASSLERHGEGGARILAAGLYDARNRATDSIESCQQVRLRMVAEADRDLTQANLGFMLRDKKGLDVTGSNLEFEGVETPNLYKGQTLQVEFRIDLPELPPGSYSFSLAIAEGNGSASRILDWVDNACILQLHSSREVLGHMRLAVEPIVNQPRESEKRMPPQP